MDKLSAIKAPIDSELNCFIESLGTHNAIMFICNVRKNGYIYLKVMMFA